MSNFLKLNNNLDILKMTTFKQELPKILDSAELDNDKFINALYELTEKEIQFRSKRAELINIHISNFPFIKRIEDFDFSFQPSISKNKIIDLTTLRFIDNYENILFVGLSGTGKTHLATSIGMSPSSI